MTSSSAANEPAGDAPPQFGRRQPGLTYADRPAAFGVCVRGDGRIALARVEKPEGTWRDLPGGAVDPGEDEPQAMIREFGEETGLVVRCGPLIARADQYFLKSDGAPVDNRSGVYVAELAGEDAGLKIEALRHDSHAWAVAAWLRRGDRTGAVG